jgi:uncharacterized protein (DUF1501 family)
MTLVSRRTFLHLGTRSLGILCAGGCLSRFSRLYAAVAPAEDYKALVCIFMMGGNDGNNVVVPIKTESQTYAAKELNAALSVVSALQTPFPSSGVGKQLQQVAQIINVRKTLGMKRQIFFVSFGDFDTHTSAMPRQNKLLADLAASMSAFCHATMELGLEKQVLTFTESEFGRTLQPSSGAGSDHAWAAIKL